jgi:hypothetical protein
VLQRLSEGRGRESVGHATSPAPVLRRGRNEVEIPGGAPRPAGPPLSDKSELPTAEQAEELCEDTEHFQEALDRLPVIDIARSVLMSVWPCTEDDACGRSWSMCPEHQHQLHDVFEAVVATARQEPLPVQLQAQLASAVADRRARESVFAVGVCPPLRR